MPVGWDEGQHDQDTILIVRPSTAGKHIASRRAAFIEMGGKGDLYTLQSNPALSLNCWISTSISST